MVTIPIVLVIAGVLLVTVAIVGGGLEIKDLKVPPLPPMGRALSAVAGVAFTGLGLFWPSGDQTDGPDRSRKGGQVAIATPHDGAAVPRKTAVAGRVSPPVPTTGSYWIVLQDEDGDSYPQRRISVQQGGRWEESITFGPAWSGKAAKILVAQASGPEDSALEQARLSGEPLPTLPPGLQGIASVRVRVQ